MRSPKIGPEAPGIVRPPDTKGKDWRWKAEEREGREVGRIVSAGHSGSGAKGKKPSATLDESMNKRNKREPGLRASSKPNTANLIREEAKWHRNRA